MGQYSGKIKRALAGRSVFLSIAAVAVALCWTGRELQAGVILPLAEEQASPVLILSGDGPGSSSAPAEPTSDSRGRHESDRRGVAIEALQGLAETGGASAPMNGVAGAGGYSAVAVVDEPVVPPVARACQYLREHRVQLPQPPPGELLDPPKAD